jgi:hypothetical protein
MQNPAVNDVDEVLSGAGTLKTRSLTRHRPGIFKKLSKSLLTWHDVGLRNRLTNEGGGAAGDRRTRSEVSAGC